jgi:hypothetical protein
MRNGVLFSIARAAALASLGGAQVVALSGAGAAQADGPGESLDVVAAPRPDTHRARMLEFLEVFWIDAWNEMFSFNESGMTLAPAGAGGPRTINVHDGAETVATGQYQELARWFIPALSPAPPGDGAFVFEHFVTAGVVHGSTGRVLPLYGLAQRVVFASEGAEPIAVEAMTPVGVTETPAEAVVAAAAMLALLNGQPLEFPDGEPPFDIDDDPCLCDEIFDSRVAACLADCLACDAACGAAAIAGLLACLAAGPAAPPCIAAVLVAETLCITACIARERACVLRARTDWLLCWMECMAPSP